MIPAVAGRPFLMFLLLLGLSAPLWAVPGSWRVLGPDGGSVYDLAFAPSRPQALYAATATGVFRSLDGGASWSYSNAGLAASPQANSLAVDPVHPLTVYAAQNGAVFRSPNGGAGWLQVSSPFGVIKIVLPARGSGVVYAMSSGALYRSGDAGGTWKILTRGLPASYRPVALAADPVDPNRLYTIVVGNDSHVYGVYKSVDGGFNWKRADQGIPAHAILDALAIDPRSPKILYASTDGGQVYKSRDGGALWRPFGPELDGAANKLWVDPAGGVFAATVDRLFHIESGGKVWTDASRGLPPASVVSALIFPPGSPRSPLAAVYTNGAGRGGVFESSDGGTSWALRSKGLSALDLTSVAVAPDALWAIGDEILFKSTDRGETWKRVRFEPVGLTLLVAVDPAAPETVYVELFDYSFWRSRDGGASWERIGSTRTEISRLVFDPASPSTLYAAGNGLLKSTDGGATWTPLLSGTFFDLQISPSTPSTLYASAETFPPPSFQVLRSTDGGSTWVPKPTVGNGALLTLAVDPQSPETLYTTFAGRVYRSTDGASSWSPYGDVFQFPTITLYPLLFPASPAALHMGVWLDNVYRLVDSDDPNSWEPLGKSPGPLRFNLLAADRQDPCRIYAATAGRGLFAFTESGTAQCP